MRRHLGILLCLVILASCTSETVQEKSYTEKLISNSISASLPQIQLERERLLFKENKIKRMIFIRQYVDSSNVDSIICLDFAADGKLVRRTTKVPTTAGCLPYLLRQEFIYDEDRLIRVDNYTFKFESRSMRDNWNVTDTSLLKKFDWEDYRYNGDTTIIESGPSIIKIVKNESGNVTDRILITKYGNELRHLKYSIEGNRIEIQLTGHKPGWHNVDNFLVNENTVKVVTGEGEMHLENKYDSRGLLITKTGFEDGKRKVIVRISYEYYSVE